MTLKELENTTNLIKKYNEIFSPSIEMKTMSKLMKEQMRKKTLKKTS